MTSSINLVRPSVCMCMCIEILYIDNSKTHTGVYVWSTVCGCLRLNLKVNIYIHRYAKLPYPFFCGILLNPWTLILCSGELIDSCSCPASHTKIGCSQQTFFPHSEKIKRDNHIESVCYHSSLTFIPFPEWVQLVA